MMKSKIKIYVTCISNKIHIPDNGLFELVQGGATTSEFRLPGISHDDEGDNISQWNADFNELSTIYWAWKNRDNDYYGFFQHSCFLSFDEEMLKSWQFEYKMDTNDDAALKRLKLTDEAELRRFIEQYDVIKCNPAVFDGYRYSLYEQYCEAHEEEDLNLMIEIIQRKYPKYMPAVRKSLFEKGRGYFGNIFIMRKQYFNHFCEWMFDILFEVQKDISSGDYFDDQKRALPFLAELLTGIYYCYLEENANCKFCMLQKVAFSAVREQPLLPAFPKGKKVVPIVFASNGPFLPYCGVAVQSILNNASADCLYDIVIFYEELTPKVIKQFTEALHRENFSVRFVNVSSYFVGKELPEKGRYSRETYYRFALCEVMKNYEQVVYLDSDTLVQTDVAALHAIDLTGYALGAVQDPDTAGQYNGYRPSRKRFADRFLNFSDPYDYFQAGVLVYNIKEFSKLATQEWLMEMASRSWDLLDQDVLNVAVHGHVRYLDMAWNVLVDWEGTRANKIISLAPEALQNQYAQAYTSPKIIHYAGPRKPWNDQKMDFSKVFWETAKNSPLYRDITARIYMNQRLGKYFEGDEKKAGKSSQLINRFLPEWSRRREVVQSIIGKRLSNKIFPSPVKELKVWEYLLDDLEFPDSGLFPAFERNNVAITMQSSDFFAPYTAVTIQSIIEHRSSDRNYDIIVFTDWMSKERKNKLIGLGKNYDNVSVRVKVIAKNLEPITSNQLERYTKLAFSRVWLAHIMHNYDRIINVDSDIVVVTDLGELENVDMNGYFVAAAHEWQYAGDYVLTLGIDNPTEMAFNGGFMIQNLREIRQAFTVSQMMTMCNLRDWRAVDQCVMNILFYGKVYYLDYDWNYREDYVTLDWMHYLECKYNRNYKRLKPKIYHYAGDAKPWNANGIGDQDKFWEIAERSPFYREIIHPLPSTYMVPADMKIGYMLHPLPSAAQLLMSDSNPLKKYVNHVLPKGSKSREFIKKIVRRLTRK